MVNAKLFLQYADISLFVVIVAVLCTMWRKGLISKFKALSAYLFAALTLSSIQIPIMFYRRFTGLNKDHAYNVLFYGTEIANLIEAVLMVVIIYGIFNAAMSHFKGLQRMGRVVFRWVAGVSILLAFVSALGPHSLVSGFGQTNSVTLAVQRIQESTNVLTLCLLVFVCFSIKSLGLSYRSHVFGLSVGLGLISTVELVVAAYFWTTGAHSVYSPIYLLNSVGYISALAIWGVYFAMPEPEQKMLTLPTTSPFFHWNRIAEALGEQPGNVAINITPSMMAPGEIRAIETINRYKMKRQAEALAAAELQAGTRIADIAAS
jgi:hypothetical protein